MVWITEIALEKSYQLLRWALMCWCKNISSTEKCDCYSCIAFSAFHVNTQKNVSSFRYSNLVYRMWMWTGRESLFMAFTLPTCTHAHSPFSHLTMHVKFCINRHKQSNILQGGKSYDVKSGLGLLWKGHT